ncbi:molybdenum ABC transporter ATP-binding protein [Pseudolabrys sp. FHR47]|uniref:molybdenum ABC transporter ATP-binding protein n=1 Tax=Pseudolabrys sp. FHR47 TaxID=2562284 RepID=UPI0010BF6068|nr:molybdenum ABC transporter ATP-binding protein [Pseudolabrys sp. FHR47]
MISVDIDKQLGDFALSVSFDGDSGVTALFGPSGSGKTSIVGMIAGLIKPDRGRIVIGGETVFDSAAGIDVPAHRRRIGTVFQDGRLFPHMSVARNLGYGRWMTGLPRDAAQFRHVTELLDIAPLVDRRPGALSGGERQRVALGRALLMKPRLMLLDEPMASLDARRKSEILPYFVRLRDDTRLPMIYVSHDPAEVKALASRVVLLDAGRVVKSGGAELL